jgi:shikimate kinase
MLLNQFMQKENFMFVGMAGSGKTFYGKKLAEKIGLRFVDLDDVLLKKTGLDTTAFLEKVGDEEFLRIENQALVNIMRLEENIILSPGGSICYCPAIELAREKYFIVYLESDLETVLERIKREPRGIVFSASKSMEDIVDERDKLYRNFADVIVDARDPKSFERNLEIILGKFNQQRENKLPIN